MIALTSRSDNLVEKSTTYKAQRNTTDERPWPQRGQKRRSQQLSCRQPRSSTAWPLESAAPHIYYRICFRDIDKSFAEQIISLENCDFGSKNFCLVNQNIVNRLNIQQKNKENGESITPARTKTLPNTTSYF